MAAGADPKTDTERPDADAGDDGHPDDATLTAVPDAADPAHPWSRWPRFNPHLRLSAKGKALRRPIDTLARRLKDLEKQAGRQRGMTVQERTKFHRAVEALVCNVLAMTLVSPDLRMTIGLGSAAMHPAGGKTPAIYGRQFPRLVRLMASDEIGVVDLEVGRMDFAARRRIPSSIRPGAQLDAFPPLAGFTFAHFKQEPAEDVLFLRASKQGRSKGGFLPVPETAETLKLRKQVLRVNARLAKAEIGLKDRDGVWPALPYDRTVRRYFNNGSFSQGGRLFGGFWMNMRREDRFKLITIAGEPVVNVDYGQLFPRLAYQRQEAAPPEGDLYDIFGDGTCRSDWKLLMNAAFFSDRALKQWPEGVSREMRQRESAEHAFKLLGVKHPALAPLQGKAVGFGFMFTESTVLLDTLERLGKAGIVALPVHDAVIVAASRGEDAKAILQEAMAAHTGIADIPVKIDREPA